MYNVINKGAYIKCVGGQGWRVLKIFQKTFPSPGDHTPKYFMAPLINFIFLLRLSCSSISGYKLTFTIIFKKNIQINSPKNLIFFAISKLFYNNKKNIFQEKSSSALQQSIN